jgi:hypothetical protein
MVKVGFLVEGDTEKVIVTSPSFQEFCKTIGVEIIRNVLPTDKKKRGKDVFKNAEKMASFINILRDQGAEMIFCIRDLEDLPCITSAKNEINTTDLMVKKIIVVKKIEAWFLADSLVLEQYFGENFTTKFPEANFPELLLQPDMKLKEISMATRKGKGIGDKLLFAKSLIRNGFSLERAAIHPHCNSANYFINKLKSSQPQRGQF